MSKYEPLWKYIKDNNKEEYKLSFDEVKKIVGFDFDHAFLTYKKELLNYGYEFKKLSLKEKWVWIIKKKQLSVDITIRIYMCGGETKTIYLTKYKKDDIIELMNLKIKIIDINSDFIIISLNDDRFKIEKNKILLKEEIKVIDTNSEPISIYIRLDSIREVVL